MEKDEKYKLHLGDAYEVIKQIPTASVDLILTAPPTI
jgi:DNA modification methylase